MILLKTPYQKNTDKFEQVYKMLAQNIKCSLKKCYVYHMSYEQAEAAVRETANELLDQKKYG